MFSWQLVEAMEYTSQDFIMMDAGRLINREGSPFLFQPEVEIYRGCLSSATRDNV